MGKFWKGYKMRSVKRYIAMLLSIIFMVQIDGLPVMAATVMEAVTEAVTAESQILVNYLVVEEPVVSCPGTQRIMLGIGDGAYPIESAVLQYKKEESEEYYEATASAMTGDFVVFEMGFEEEDTIGNYILETISYSVQGQQISTPFEEMGIEAGFEVKQMAESIVVSIDENGNNNALQAIEDALMDVAAKDGQNLMQSVKGATDASDGLIIVLDPGHGGIDGGAQGYGVSEKVANLKIAKYCKEELEKFAGVTVYMTRSDDDTYLTLEQRANFAKEKKADIFVSLHINSNESSTPNGANVYYPNANYNKNCNKTGKELAKLIESNLTDLGLASGGIHIRNSGDGTKYEDGSLADYYGVIKRCKEYGIPAVLVEHAFISNEKDVKNFLSSDEQLKKLGMADAAGIAEYYSLGKEGETDAIPQPEMAMLKSQKSTSMVIGWDIVDGVAGYEIYRAGKADGEYKKLGIVTGADTCKFTDSKAKAGKLYYYKIRAYAENEGSTIYSAYSQPIYGRTAKIPSAITVASADGNGLQISWIGDANASGYIIQRSKSASKGFKKIATIEDAAITTYADTTVKAGDEYYYRIQSFNYNYGLKGKSGYSAAVSGKILDGTKITKVAGIKPKQMTIAWTPRSDVSGYEIYRSTTKKGTYTKVATIKSASKATYTDKKLVPGTKYYYKVRTFVDNNGNINYGMDSKPRGAQLGVKPVISSIQGTTGSKIKISWNSIPGAKEYRVYRSTSKKGTYTKIATLKSDKLSYTDKKLKMTQTYFYRIDASVKGYKMDGGTGNSKVVSASPKQTGEITSAGTNEKGQMQINWGQVKNISGYNLYRSTSANGDYTLISTIKGAKNTSFIDKKAAVGITYYYVLELIGSYNGETLYGARSLPISGIRLGAPKDVTVSSISENQLNITWSSVAGATGYYIYRSTEYNGTYAYIGNLPKTHGIGFTDTGVTKGVTYYYKIRAYEGSSSIGPYSGAASGTPVEKPVILDAALSSDGKSIHISWNPSQAGVLGYEVFRSSYSKPSVQTKVATLGGTAYTDTNIVDTEVYYYRVRTYTKVTVNGTTRTVYGEFSDTVSTNKSDYKIMGSAGVTVKQMVSMYQASGKKYPASVYASKEAADLQTFCQIVYDECAIEGVKPEVIFAQICHETGYLQFGGQVKAEQCNFGGLGATDDGALGGTFENVRIGVRAQVQHMKAYASTDPLIQACVDNRFSYITRGKAEYIQQLGKGNWATDTAYDIKLLSYINKIKEQ